MSFVRTVLGDISPAALGPCYAHEHLVMESCFANYREPAMLLDETPRTVEELTSLHHLGLRAMVDAMPGGAGRNVLKLAAISQGSGVRIISSTGVHAEHTYAPGHWSLGCTTADLTKLFVAEIQDGIDTHDYRGPVVTRSPHRAGLIKVAAGVPGEEGLSAHETRLFLAAAEAQRETGCPILTHVEAGLGAMEQVRILEKADADLSRVTLSHLDRNANRDDHREALRAGVNLSYDNILRLKSTAPLLELIHAMAEEFPNQIVLGTDGSRKTYWTSYAGKPGLAILWTTAHAALPEAMCQRLFVANPARAFQFGQ